ncbi:hypothetical protein [Burkholderia anthina]|uniref:hypothetical protein n=1 Tax=Burkholderia anthina TaxID=179879 RepID=UPI001AA02230|nr:hypothetical protein [Burkholderia anthina]QTD92840.1 hypothetical protein J4G50_32070 [Burkholderia anthina]
MLAAEGKREQAFAPFYTGTIGAVAGSVRSTRRIAGVPAALLALASVLLPTLPLS